MPSRNAAASTSDGVSSVLGTRVEIAVAIRLVAGAQHDVRREVHVEPRVEFDVGMDRADFEDAVLQELRDAQALRAGIREVELSGDAALEEIEMLGAAHARNDEMQVVDDFRIDLREGTRQEIRLFLVVALDDHAVARGDERLQDIDDALGG
jgi:hypothetical protein